jgi:ADP-L-glycero-D-manno-heptose 6-epimerase
MIVVTGAAGFIGSCMVSWLNSQGYKDLILVDDFTQQAKIPNWKSKQYSEAVDREAFFDWCAGKERFLQCVIHLGARTNTAEFDEALLHHLNTAYSQKLWQICTEHQIPFIYASSAATYGGGEFGYSESSEVIRQLQPLNPYGWSKQKFDLWVLEQKEAPVFWAGLKFFNVYGPNEYHKARMASVIWHSWVQIKAKGEVNLFRSHHPDFQDGRQLRDFIYVKDVVSVIGYLMEQRPHSQIYNLGTGQARAFLDLAQAVFTALDLEPIIHFVDIPEDIRDKYQYFTEADMSGLRMAGYTEAFITLEAGVQDYVQNYLEQGKRIY